MIASLEGHISRYIPFFKITRMLGSLRNSPPDKVIATYKFDQRQSLAIAAFLQLVVGEQGEHAERQAKLNLVQAWEIYVQD
ncbi:MAG TPA: hypothetical protein V6D20_09040 [Candidatus Obscuribacterales bacterium]